MRLGFEMSCSSARDRRKVPALVFFVSLMLASSQSRAADSWSEPFVGVRYLHRTLSEPRLSIHVALVDLASPGIRLVATSPQGKRATVSSFARGVNAQLAVNGDFFNLDTRVPICYAMGGGEHWQGTGDDQGCGQVAAGGNRVDIIPPPADFQREPWMSEVVSGHPLLLRAGAVIEHGKNNSLAQTRHPRTAVGLSRDGRTLYLLVVDGRQDHSVGMRADEVAKVLQGLGAWSALNLDGGGSSAMYVAGRGIVNRPSDGQERLDANHLGVHAASLKPGKKGEAADSGTRESPSTGSGSGTSGGGASATGSGASSSGSASSGRKEEGSSATGGGSGAAGDSKVSGSSQEASRLLPGIDRALASTRKGAEISAYQARALRRANKVAESDIESRMRSALAQPWKDPLASQGEVRRGPISPVQGKISRGFGPSEDVLLPPRPSNGVMHEHFHGGIDLTAPEGSPVKAFDLGRVAFIGASAGAGVHVVLSHPGGLATAYTHLADGPRTRGLKAGQYVNAGQVIGQVGKTGVTLAPHLHFMASRGWLIDPRGLLRVGGGERAQTRKTTEKR